MKKILFPALNRVHLARQNLLLKELKKDFEVDILESEGKIDSILSDDKYDLALIRGDRYEMLPIAMLCAYKGVSIAHIEGGDLSGAIDNKVRYAISSLADLHFTTNEASLERVRAIGSVNPDNAFNYGSLDVEIASKVIPENKKEEYLVVCYHPLEGEDPSIIDRAVRTSFKGKVHIIKSNSDYGITYGTEEYSPQEYLKLIANARCLVGNSSSFIKEASIFGTPVVLVGKRQDKRLLTHNIMKVPFEEKAIVAGIQAQVKSHYDPSRIYYQKNTSQKIAKKIKEFLK